MIAGNLVTTTLSLLAPFPVAVYTNSVLSNKTVVAIGEGCSVQLGAMLGWFCGLPGVMITFGRSIGNGTTYNLLSPMVFTTRR